MPAATGGSGTRPSQGLAARLARAGHRCMGSNVVSPEDAAAGPGPRGRRGGGKRGAGAARAKGSRRGRREVSAGGVVVRGDPGSEEVVAIVPVRRAVDGSRVLGLPKGHVDPGETPLQAATREVREETGLVAEPVADLGEVRYWYRRDGRSIGKSVTFYLFRFVSGDTEDHDHEIEHARWLDLREARTELTYEGERGMIERALAHLQEGAQGGASH